MWRVSGKDLDALVVDGAANEALLINARLAKIEKEFESILERKEREVKEKEGVHCHFVKLHLWALPNNFLNLTLYYCSLAKSRWTTTTMKIIMRIIQIRIRL